MNANNLPLPVFSPAEIPFGQWFDNRNTASDAPVAENHAQNPAPLPDHFLSLPMAVEDLGRLPIYGSLDLIPDATGAVDALGFPVSNPVVNVYDASNVDMDGYLDVYL